MSVPVKRTDLPDLAERDRASTQRRTHGHSWNPIRLTAAGSRPPAAPSIGGLAYEGRLHIWSGEPESLKSLTALALAADEIRAGRVALYVDHEGSPHETLSRLRELGVEDEQVDAGFVYLAPEEPMRGAAVEDVARLVEKRRPSLVVVDSYTASLALHGADDYRGTEVERHYQEAVRPLRASGAAAVLIDHLAKNREGRGRYSIASERKLALCDVHLGFEVETPLGRGGRGLVRIWTRKDRPGHLPRPKTAEITFTSDPATHSLTWTASAPREGDEPSGFRPTVLMERVSDFLAAQSEPVSRRSVEGARLGRAVYLRQALDFLVLDGHVIEERGPRGARLYRLARPYPGDDLVPTSSRPGDPDLVPTSSRQERLSDAV